MTEDEAKAKWCPHAVASHTDPRAVVDYTREGLPANTFLHCCIASACMAWRWEDHVFQDGEPWPITARHAHGHTARKLREGEKLGGFCGLAGSPQ